MSSVIIAIERKADDCKDLEDLMVKEIAELLAELSYKKSGEIDERDPGHTGNDRRLRFKPLAYGET